MAGDWIKITKALPDKPEVWAIAEKLNLDPDAVVGKLLRVWSWFDDQSENGNALSVTRMLLDRQVGVVGFCDALAGVGWLDIEQDYIAIPNFDRHNSETAKSRALAALRAAKLRKKKQIAALELQDSNGDSVTSLLPEKRREEKSNKELNNITSLARFGSDRFAPSDQDLVYARRFQYEGPLEMHIASFVLYHKEAGTIGNASYWSKLFKGWIDRNCLPPIQGM